MTDAVALVSLAATVLFSLLALEVVDPSVLSARLQYALQAPRGSIDVIKVAAEEPAEILRRQLDGGGAQGSAAPLHAALAALAAGQGSEDEALRHLEAARTHAAEAAAAAPPPQQLGEIVVWVGPEREALAEAVLALAQAYLERGRAEDADRELETVRSSLVGLEDLHMAAVLRTQGKAKRELGFLSVAHKYYKLAQSRVERSAPSDRAAAEELVADLAGLSEVLLLQGKEGEAEAILRDALATLRSPIGMGPSVSGDAAEGANPGLASELHRFLGDALSMAGDSGAALRHYRKAQRLEKRLSQPRTQHIARLEEKAQKAQEDHRRKPPAQVAQTPLTGAGALGSGAAGASCSSPRCTAESSSTTAAALAGASRTPFPAGRRAIKGTPGADEECSVAAPGKAASKRAKASPPPPADSSLRGRRAAAPAPQASAPAADAEEPLSARVDRLLAEGKAQQAEAACSVALASLSESLRGLEVAGVRLLLGRVYRRQQRFPEAAQEFSKALALAFASGKSGPPEIMEAYNSLSYIQVMFHAQGQAEAAEGILRETIALADDAGIHKDRPDRKSGERILRANARPAVVMPADTVLPAPKAPAHHGSAAAAASDTARHQ